MVAVAAVNGANDIGKAVAPLAGGHRSSERSAVLWGVGWTALGSCAALVSSDGLLSTFTGAGFLARAPDGLRLALAVAAGATAWIATATFLGLPVSTTHALVGGLVGVGLWSGSGILAGSVVRSVVLPLALSPFVAAALGWALNGFSSATEGMPGRAERLGTWGTAAAIALGRGMNDTPKIVALGALAAASAGVRPEPLFVLAALAMAGGGLIAGGRVTDTIGRRVTPLDTRTGFAASAATAALVLAAVAGAMPVSTTHVTGGAVVGAAAGHAPIRWSIVRRILAAWFVTVPLSALLSAAAWNVLPR